MLRLTIDSIEVFLRVIMELLRFFLELLESSLGIEINSVLGVFANIEARFKLLRRS